MKTEPNSNTCLPRSTRRRFQTTVGALSAGVHDRSPEERLRFVLIGVGGHGTRTSPAGRAFADLVALCDVDTQNLE